MDTYTKYKMCLSMMMVICISNAKATFEAQYMKKLSNTEAEMKKSVAYKKKRVLLLIFLRKLHI